MTNTVPLVKVLTTCTRICKEAIIVISKLKTRINISLWYVLKNTELKKLTNQKHFLLIGSVNFFMRHGTTVVVGRESLGSQYSCILWHDDFSTHGNG